MIYDQADSSHAWDFEKSPCPDVHKKIAKKNFSNFKMYRTHSSF